MRNLVALILILALPQLSYSKPIIVAVIDTGFGYNGLGKKAKLCKTGHKDFTTERAIAPGYNTIDPIPKDYMGHGTNIVGIIDAQVKSSNYCIVIIKYFSLNSDNLESSLNAIKYAIEINANYINYSSNGRTKNTAEIVVVKRFLDKGGVFVAAAGNEGVDLHKINMYPAMSDSRVIVVGNLGLNGKKATSSNYGLPVTIWETGTNIDGFGLVMTGTSQATAIVTSKMIKQRIDNLK